MTVTPLAARIAVNAVAAVILGYLMLPILAVVPASFNHASFITLPPNQVSWRWYQAFFADREWMMALANSVEIAVLATIIAVVLGTMAALGLQRLEQRLRALVNGLFLAPLIVPVVVTAIALYRSAIDVAMTGTVLALAIGHAILALPFVVINVGVSLLSVDRSWHRAAAGLGAGSWTIFRTITLPHIVPGIIGGAVFAALTSFDEAVVSLFLAGYQTKTLPVKMWEAIRIEFTPVVAVAATLMMLLAIVLFLLARLATRQQSASPR